MVCSKIAEAFLLSNFKAHWALITSEGNLFFYVNFLIMLSRYTLYDSIIIGMYASHT